MFNRREFLRTSAASTGLVAWGLSAPEFLRKAAAATPKAGKPGAKDTILVVVELNGGNDGLNTVIPFKDPEYTKLRPSLKISPEQVLKVNDDIGLNPTMTGFKELLDDNALCIAQGVGYPNPNESHFRSMDIWQAASLGENLSEGWLGRTLRGMTPESKLNAATQAFTTAFHIGDNNEAGPLALAGAPAKVPTIARLEDFQPRTLAVSNSDGKAQRKLIESSVKLDLKPKSTGGSDLLDFVNRTAVNTYASSRRLQEMAQTYQPKVPYQPTGLATRLRLAAQLIQAEVGARIFYVSIGGFDTHANQTASHGNLLFEVSDAITTFFKDMTAHGLRDQVLIMTFSEFGRRAGENGSQGTDHGSGAPMFLVGGKVRPGVVGAHPSLTDLQAGNLKFHTDFRSVYAAVAEQWLGVPAKTILDEEVEASQVLSV